MKVIISLLLLLSFTAHANTLQLTYYPSKNYGERLVESGITRLIVANRPEQPGRVGYPSNGNVETLNYLIDHMAVNIWISEGSYPSTSGAKKVNELNEDISVGISIENCLTSSSERRRIESIERSARITIACYTERTLLEAVETANKIMQEHPHLKISVFLTR